MADGVCLKVPKANYFAAAIHAAGEEKGTRIIFQSLQNAQVFDDPPFSDISKCFILGSIEYMSLRAKARPGPVSMGEKNRPMDTMKTRIQR